MCDSPVQAFLCDMPKREYNLFFINTHQYREYAQFDKEYLFFNDKYCNRFENVRIVYVPCGKCIQCRYSRSKSWEIRSVYEMFNSKKCICLTLTYDDEHLPTCADFVQTDKGLVQIPEDKKGLIDYKDVQDFVKRLRKHFHFKREIRYVCSSEYGGSGTLRPHFHLMLFGVDLSDFGEDIRKLKKRVSKKGTILYKSPFMKEKWTKGFVDVGKADVQACRYVSQYCCKDLLKERKCNKINRFILSIKNKLGRECIHSSQGLGFDTFRRNYWSIVKSGFIQLGKYRYAIPRYFIKKLEFINNDLFQNVKQKFRDFWLNFKWTIDDQRQARIRSEDILDRLNLFHSDTVNLLMA